MHFQYYHPANFTLKFSAQCQRFFNLSYITLVYLELTSRHLKMLTKTTKSCKRDPIDAMNSLVRETHIDAFECKHFSFSNLLAEDRDDVRNWGKYTQITLNGPPL